MPLCLFQVVRMGGACTAKVMNAKVYAQCDYSMHASYREAGMHDDHPTVSLRANMRNSTGNKSGNTLEKKRGQQSCCTLPA